MRLDSVREIKQAAKLPAATTLAAGRPQAVFANVPSIALGAAVTDSPGEYRLAIRVQRSELLHSAEVEMLTGLANGEVDIEVVGLGHKQTAALTSRLRPLRPGASVGHPDITAGTLGCFVSKDGDTYILSNNHVLADEDRAATHEAIIQPGSYDGGAAPADTVATLSEVEPLSLTRPNQMDAAIALLADGIDYEATWPWGSVYGVTDVDGVQAVAKLGRTSKLTHGTITAIEVDGVVMNYETGRMTFDSVIQVRGTDGRFTEGGDSGSLVVTDDSAPRAVALHFGALANGTSVMSPIGAILGRFGVALVP